MIREALVKHWDVIQAFKDGKKLKVRFGDSFIDNSSPSFGFYEEYLIVEKKQPTKRLPTIEEVEKWFLENKVFYHKLSNMVTRIIVIDRNQSEKQIGLQGGWISICDFIEEFTHYDGSELYITES